MGFGWMFLGLFFLLPSIPNGAFAGADISSLLRTVLVVMGGSARAALGFLLIHIGYSKANVHCTCFGLTKRMSLFGVVISAVYFAFELVSKLATVEVPGAMSNIFYVVYAAFLLGFFLCYARSIILIATETGVEKIRRRGAVSMILSVIFLFVGRLFQITGSVFASMDRQTAYWLSVGGFVAETVFIIYALITTFSCYMWICLEGDEDMPDNRRFKYTTPMDFYDRDKKKCGGKK